MHETNSNTANKRSILGIISIVIAILIGICFVIFEAITLIGKQEEPVLFWGVCTLVTAPIGIIIGLIAVFTKRVWVGLVLNILFLMLDVLVIMFYLLQGVTAFR